MPFGIQPIHLILIIVVALIIFGPSRLPEIGRGLGKSINEFRKGAKEMTDGFKDEVAPAEAAPVAQAAAPVAAQAAPVAPVAPVAAPAPATVTCPSCGKANAAGAAFCNNCGTKLAY
ncbi:MAG TPA: twin-arginine translocase TatA/TatE family subunit [Anaerolineae bacterium]|jgi:TatA/E family protein of Tat protein translocase